ncbi:RHS repeat domain-containing protein [Alistipes finegoldii]|jgi:YD repeat-containing protein|uniref:RHS repeat protein n=1 Tax=Alistipes finegoldii TaxID=214856 RepID=UPI003AEF8E8C
MKKKLLTSVLATTYVACLFGQSTSPTVPTLPDITFKSPKAASMQKFGDYPVSLFTGLVDITVPVYEIEINGIKVPIEFKYHASGIKYDDTSLELGLGWSFMAGGLISHQVRGDDRITSGIPAPGSPEVKRMEDIDPRGLGSTNIDSGNIYLECIARGTGAFGSYSPTFYSTWPIDGEMDIVQYVLPTQQGSVAYHKGQTIYIPNRPISFSFPQHMIRDEKGITYLFEEEERYNFSDNTTRHLTKIISADKSDTVSFTYETRRELMIIAPSFLGVELGVEAELSQYLDLDLRLKPRKLTNPSSSQLSSPPLLKEISYRGGKICFLYDPVYIRSLTEVQIYAGDPQKMQMLSKIKVVQSDFYETDRSPRRLDKVTFCDGNGKELYDYQFGYNGRPRLLSDSGFDYWGYFNSAPATDNRVPRFEVLYNIAYAPDPVSVYTNTEDRRNPDPVSSGQGMLNKIVYPTKGYTKFQYEAHKSGGVVLGGQRIRSIEHYDSDNTLMDKRTYQYGEHEDGNGSCLANLVSNGALNIDKSDFYSTNKIISQTSENHGMVEIGYYAIIDVFNVFPRRSYTINGSSAVYPVVTEYYGDETSNIGKVVYSYNYYDSHYPHWTYRGRNPDYPFRSYEWKNGTLCQKMIYDKNNKLIYSETNDYQDIRTEEKLNIKAVPEVTVYGDASGARPSPDEVYLNFSIPEFSDETAPYFDIIGQSRFDYFNYCTNTGLPVIRKSTVMRDGVTKTIDYQYNDLGQCIRSAECTSQGDSIVTEYKYPYDLRSVAPYSGMYSCNMLSTVVEQAISRGSGPQQIVKTNYSKVNNGYYPYSQQFWNHLQNELETRIIYHEYDKYGNPVYITKDNTTKIVYLWGYKGRYPIAEFRDVDYTTVRRYLGAAFIEHLLDTAEISMKDMATIDNMRRDESFKQIHITTYTYKPGVGLTSETDPAGRTTTYKYDAAGNLSRVLDHKGYVMNSYEYNYKVK